MDARISVISEFFQTCVDARRICFCKNKGRSVSEASQFAFNFSRLELARLRIIIEEFFDRDLRFIALSSLKVGDPGRYV